MGLVFKHFKLAVPYRFRNEEPLPLVVIYRTIICGNTFLKDQIHGKSEKNNHTIHIHSTGPFFKAQDYSFAPNSGLKI